MNDADTLAIDRSRLDREWLRQPQLSRSAGRQHADAEHEYNLAKANLALVAARVLLQVRRTPGAFNLRDKPNESEIEAAVTLHNDHRAAVERLNLAERDLGYAKAETVALVDRRKALENYVTLLQLEYVSEREARPADPEVRDRLARQTAKELAGGGMDLGDTVE